MNDPYIKVFEDIVKVLNKHSKMIEWIAKRTLSVNDFIEFVNKFAEKQESKAKSAFEDWIKGEGM